MIELIKATFGFLFRPDDVALFHSQQMTAMRTLSSVISVSSFEALCTRDRKLEVTVTIESLTQVRIGAAPYITWGPIY